MNRGLILEIKSDLKKKKNIFKMQNMQKRVKRNEVGCK